MNVNDANSIVHVVSASSTDNSVLPTDFSRKVTRVSNISLTPERANEMRNDARKKLGENSITYQLINEYINCPELYKVTNAKKTVSINPDAQTISFEKETDRYRYEPLDKATRTTRRILDKQAKALGLTFAAGHDDNKKTFDKTEAFIEMCSLTDNPSHLTNEEIIFFQNTKQSIDNEIAEFEMQIAAKNGRKERLI